MPANGEYQIVDEIDGVSSGVVSEEDEEILDNLKKVGFYFFFK